MAKVTIIIPVYNGAAFLPELLDSIIAQTSKGWNCICVNDGSTDDSLALLNRYAERDDRITVIDQPNGGCGTARNTAMQLVLTPFVTFADQDDILHPQAFEIAVNAIEASGVDCLCFGFSHFTDMPNFQHLRPHWDIFYETRRQGLDLITGKKDSWTIFVWRHIFRTQSVREVPFPPISGGEDQAWMTELSWRNLKWASIEPVLYANRDRSDSRSRGISKSYINNIFASYDWIRERAKLYNIDSKRLNKFIRHMAIMFRLSVIYRQSMSLILRVLP